MENNPDAQQTWTEKLRRATELDLPYSRWLPSLGRPAAVLALFALNAETESLSVLLSKRTETVQDHRGQIAFPGGRPESADEDQGGLRTTALRETEEEVGISRDQIVVCGQLPPVATLTGYVITPFVGILRTAHELQCLRPSASEISDLRWVRLSLLREPNVYAQELVAAVIRTDVFRIDPGFRVWGATALILKNLLDRIEKAG